MRPGTQIAYVPLHARGDLLDPDVEFGFVTSERGDAHFCRYWRRGHPGELRTLANSELTPSDCLVEHKSIQQFVVDGWMAGLAAEDNSSLGRYRVTHLTAEQMDTDMVVTPGEDQVENDGAGFAAQDEQEPFCPHCDAGVGLCSGPHKGTDEVPY